MRQNEDAHASVHLGQWKLTAQGDFFRADSSAAFELYDLESDPAETRDLAAEKPDLVRDLGARLREFGSWQQPGVSAYSEGRAGFKAPKDWLITRP